MRSSLRSSMRSFMRSASRSPLRFRSRPGFTLTELLIVIVIVGLLIAVAAPSWMSTRGSVGETALRADLARLQGAMTEAYNVNSAYPAASGPQSQPLAALPFRPSPAISYELQTLAGGQVATIIVRDSVAVGGVQRRCQMAMGAVANAGVTQCF